MWYRSNRQNDMSCIPHCKLLHINETCIESRNIETHSDTSGLLFLYGDAEYVKFLVSPELIVLICKYSA